MVTLQRSPGAAHVSNGAAPATESALITEFEVPSAAGNERVAIERVSAAVERLNAARGAARAAQDRRRRGHDERDGARQPVPRATSPWPCA